MSKYITIKEYLTEVELFMRRLMVVFVGILILCVLLLYRLATLQIMHHEHYTTMSQQNLLKILPIPPKRGLIYDRNGVLLAENIPVYSLEIIRSEVTDLANTITRLQTLIPISEAEIDSFYRVLAHRRQYESVPLKIKLSEIESARFYANRFLFPGVDIRARLIRQYPLAEQMAHVVGYVGRINSRELNEVDSSEYSATNYIGKVGIESTYENTLHGHVGYQQAEIDATGRVIRVLKQVPAIAGDDIYLTIDSQLQEQATLALEDHRGAIVALAPNNGQILAMASTPSFDPNLFITGISNKDYQTLQASENRPLYNRAINAQYPPASTIKPFMALGGLAFHIISPQNSIQDPGWYKLQNNEHIYHDWKKGGHGIVNLTKALTVSCDTYFFDLAHHLGIDHINQILHQFGFGESTGIDMPNELAGILPNPTWKRLFHHAKWFSGDTLNIGIGQGFMLATPLQLAVATASLATHGTRYQPTLLYKEQAADGSLSQQQPILTEAIVLKEHSWEVVTDGMIRVIQESHGTAHRFGSNTNYTVAGKTGTAQVTSKHFDKDIKLEDIPERLRDHSLFIAFAPVDHPQIALAVIVENDPRAAVKATRKVLDFYFKKRALP